MRLEIGVYKYRHAQEYFNQAFLQIFITDDYQLTSNQANTSGDLLVSMGQTVFSKVVVTMANLSFLSL